MRWRSPASLAACVLVLTLAACGPSADEAATVRDQVDQDLAAPFDDTRVHLTDGERRIELDAFVADTPSLRRQGLQGWEHLPERTGMVFTYAQDVTGGFWMKDTLIPLSIAFAAADGRIHTIREMEPCDIQPCPTYGPNAPYRYALEVNQGLYGELGVAPGWRLEISESGAACDC